MDVAQSIFSSMLKALDSISSTAANKACPEPMKPLTTRGTSKKDTSPDSLDLKYWLWDMIHHLTSHLGDPDPSKSFWFTQMMRNGSEDSWSSALPHHAALYQPNQPRKNSHVISTSIKMAKSSTTGRKGAKNPALCQSVQKMIKQPGLWS